MTNLEVKQLETTSLTIGEKLKQKYSHSEIERTCKYIKRFGIHIPLVINKKREIVFLEHIYLAAKELDIKEVPVVELESLNEQEVKAFKIASKKISCFGEFDLDDLKIEVTDLIGNFEFNFDELGFDAIEIDNFFFIEDENRKEEIATDDEKIEENNIKEIVKKGDLIQLGKHKLYCGDSLDPQSYEILLKNEKANIVITDPPYNVKIQNNVTNRTCHKEFEQASGEMTEKEFENFLKTAFNNLKKFSVENSIHYIFMDWRHSFTLQKASKDVYPKLQNICIWDKTKAGMGSFYRSQHEFCFVFQNGNGEYCNNIQLGKNGRYRSNIWQYQGMNISTKQANKLSKLHPTVKSTAMLIDILLDASKPQDIVLDAFGGSGSTLIAAEESKRRARLIELSPHYCDVIIHRWEELTGKKHKILNRGT